MKYVLSAIIFFILSGIVWGAAAPLQEKNCEFPAWMKNKLNGKEHTYCKDGEKLPLILLSAQTPLDQKVYIYINEKKLYESSPPRNTMFSATLNHYLYLNSENHLKIEYERISLDSNISGGAANIEVSIAKQEDWLEPDSSELIDLLYGPKKKNPQKYEKGSIESFFSTEDVYQKNYILDKVLTLNPKDEGILEFSVNSPIKITASTTGIKDSQKSECGICLHLKIRMPNGNIMWNSTQFGGASLSLLNADIGEIQIVTSHDYQIKTDIQVSIETVE